MEKNQKTFNHDYLPRNKKIFFTVQIIIYILRHIKSWQRGCNIIQIYVRMMPENFTDQL